jgi:hypothetical protein
MKVLAAILLGGLAAGALDILSAFTTFVPRGATEMGILQYIASGVLGPRSFEGGWGSAGIGLAVHFALTTAMAGVFVAASRFFSTLVRAPWIAGSVFGVLAYFAMAYAIVPLSAVEDWKPGGGWSVVSGLMAHTFYVGLPIALIAKRFLAPDPAPAKA